jgi:hypothetical protein
VDREIPDNGPGAISILFISRIISKRNVPGPVLTKPFGPSAFLEQVARMLPRAHHHYLL